MKFDDHIFQMVKFITLPETNRKSQLKMDGWLRHGFPFGMASWQVRAVSGSFFVCFWDVPSLKLT